MPNLIFLCQSGIWPILCQLMAILANLLDMNFKFVFRRIYINFDIQTKFEVNQTKIGHYILRNTPKNHFGKKYFELGVGGDGQDTPDILKVVLGPYVQYCPARPRSKNWGKNQNLN